MLDSKSPDTDQHPLVATFSSLGRRMHALARRLLRDPADADDAVQDAFVKLWSRRATIVDRHQADAVSMTTVRNVCIDMLRRSSAHPHSRIDESPPPDAEASPPPDSSEMAAEVKALINTVLSPMHREILFHRDHDGWDIDELAEHYSTTPANIRVILSRSRRLVRETYLKRTL